MTDRIDAQRIADDLEEPVREANALAEKLGLEPYPVNYWIVDYDEMNELIAYGGFQTRYPHWRWGMKYDRQQKQGQFLGGKAFEIVNNDDPAHAFLQESNSLSDQKAVITHVEAHADFFANNEWFGMFADDPNAAAMLARHGDSIEEYMEDADVERSEVEKWVDHVLTLEDNVDQHEAYQPVQTAEDVLQDRDTDEMAEQLDELDLSEEVMRQVFDEEWLEANRDEDDATTFPAEPDKDIIGFLRKHGKQYDEDAGKALEMEDWQKDVLEILRREAYYFAPQKMTKVMNEGWACVAPETPIFTESGIVSMKEVVEKEMPVSDGENAQSVYDSNVIENHETITIETRRGIELTGSNNHRIRRPDGSWIRLDELDEGDEIEVSGGNELWATEEPAIDWKPPSNKTLDDVADEAGVSIWTVMRYRKTGTAECAEQIEAALGGYTGEDQSVTQRDQLRVPDTVDEKFGRFLGLLIGDGHVSTAAGQVGFTNESQQRAEHFAGLVEELFGVNTSVENQDSRWRVYVYSRNLVDLLQDAFGLPDGKAASKKQVPDKIKCSPQSVVAEFIRGLFDADGYAGKQGVILSTKSEPLGKTVQLLLFNFGILSRRRQQTDGCYHVHLTGESAATFEEKIGFGFGEKREKLRAYLDDLAWFENESWTDEITSIESSEGTVYDISVEETHRYAGGGLVNHNSYWESAMMTGENFAGDDEFIVYADHMARVLGSPGLNPYKLGLELWEYIENTVNRREVVERLLRVEDVTWRNFQERVDFDDVLAHLEPDDVVASVDEASLAEMDPDDPRVDAAALEVAREGDIDVEAYPWKVLTYEGMVQRHYSLVKPQYRGFLGSIGQNELERIARYMFDDARYDSIDEALADVDYARGWDRMREIRESHNDVTFLDEFLTQEFVDENDYFTYEYMQSTGDYRVTSSDYEDVKKKLMLQFTNFGKPTVVVEDGNYDNAGELLLAHQYNGVSIDVGQAKEVLKRVFELWGRPVHLKTILKEYDEHDVEVAKRRDKEPEPEEQGKLVSYDGEEVIIEDLDWDAVEHLAAGDIDYDTKPEEWLT